MSIGTAFSAFFSILGSSEKAKLWQEAAAGALPSQDELKKLQAKDEQQGKDLTQLRRDLDQARHEAAQSRKELQESLAQAASKASGEGRQSAVLTLSLLQREGRLVDFLMEDISSYADDQVGAAVRQVHAGSAKALKRHFAPEAIAAGTENEAFSLAAGFNPEEYELTGRSGGAAPYQGTLIHRGWKVSKVDLPSLTSTRSTLVIKPAEIEL